VDLIVLKENGITHQINKLSSFGEQLSGIANSNLRELKRKYGAPLRNPEYRKSNESSKARSRCKRYNGVDVRDITKPKWRQIGLILSTS